MNAHHWIAVRDTGLKCGFCNATFTAELDATECDEVKKYWEERKKFCDAIAQKQPATHVYVLLVDTDSSDHYGPYVFARKPTPKELKAFCQENFPSEFDGGCEEPGPGRWGSWLFTRLYKRKVRTQK